MANPRLSHAVFLPPGWSPDRVWPVLYLFDARGRGAHAAERFVPAAREAGWVVVSSNDSRSDGPLDPNLEAMKAMLADAHARFAVDDRRSYAGGFSGGARVSALMAQILKAPLAGVVLCGGGFPEDRPPRKGLSFAVFATVGDRDFNYYEMRRLDRTLEEAGVTHRLETFDGGHGWPPEPLAGEAVRWLEVQALRRGLRAPRPGDETLLATERAREAAAASAGTDPAARKREKEARKAEERDLRKLGLAEAVLSEALEAEPPPPLAKVLGALDVPSLQKAAAGEDREARLSALRLLAAYHVRTGFYLARDFAERKDAAREAWCRKLGEATRPPVDPF